MLKKVEKKTWLIRDIVFLLGSVFERLGVNDHLMLFGNNEKRE
jgi:hypothetical protein